MAVTGNSDACEVLCRNDIKENKIDTNVLVQ